MNLDIRLFEGGQIKSLNRYNNFKQIVGKFVPVIDFIASHKLLINQCRCSVRLKKDSSEEYRLRCVIFEWNCEQISCIHDQMRIQRQSIKKCHVLYTIIMQKSQIDSKIQAKP